MFVELQTLTGKGGTGFGDAQTLPRWRKHLEDSIRTVSGQYSRALHEVHEKVKTQNITCARCRLPKYRLDFCEFLCTPEKRDNKAKFSPIRPEDAKLPHRFCQDCIATLIRIQSRSVQWKMAEMEDLKKVLGGVLYIIPCPLCRSPNVLSFETLFQEGFERQNCAKNGVMKNYSVHQAATRRLAENYVVEECFENQRRPPFGVFTKENLLEMDWCGPFSTEGMTCIENLNVYFAPPNRSWLWLEDWEPDQTMGGASGWMYARRWLTNERYENVISLFHLVRRRRLLRTRVRFDEIEIRSELASFAEEIKTRAAGAGMMRGSSSPRNSTS
jgi:hypothetical protein